MEQGWNLWHGCHKISEGCKNCYVYRRDSKYDIDSTRVVKTASFAMPVKKDKKGNYKYPSGTIFWTCFTSDFLIEEADEWRKDAWDMIRERSDCQFIFITKRISRLYELLPPDWGEGWENVKIGCTIESNRQAGLRMPCFVKVHAKHKFVCCEPLLEKVDLSPWLASGEIDAVIAGGESGENARECHYEWITYLRSQCVQANVNFSFKQTGAIFVKDGRYYQVPRKLQHAQAVKANINFQAK